MARRRARPAARALSSPRAICLASPTTTLAALPASSPAPGCVASFGSASRGGGTEVLHIHSGVEDTSIGRIAQGRLNEDVTDGANIELDVQLSTAAGDVNLLGTESTEQTAWGIRIQEVTATHRRDGNPK